MCRGFGSWTFPVVLLVCLAIGLSAGCAAKKQTWGDPRTGLVLTPDADAKYYAEVVVDLDVIDARVPLKKTGREYQACCPFHNEKTPSFTVSPGKQFYHCFGCGAHGTSIGFLMEYDHMEFNEAVEQLAERLGLEVPRERNLQTGDIVHPSLVYILDAEGTVAYGATGHARLMEELLRRL